jgi:hypothetical protein
MTQQHPKKPKNLLIKVAQAPPRQFRKCLFLTITSLAIVNFAIIFLVHPSDSDWLPLYEGFAILPSSFTSTNSTTVPKKHRKRRVGIGSKLFRSKAHVHNVSSDCYRVGSDAVLEEWKSGQQTVCTISSPSYTKGWFGNENNTIDIQEYVLKSWEYEPTFVRYSNVEGYWGRDILPMGCPSNTRLRHEHLGVITHIVPPWLGKEVDTTRNSSDIIEVYDTVIQVRMFEQHNPYERFHAMLNAAMVMRMLDIVDPQFVLLLNSEGGREKMTNNTIDMWRSLSTIEPIIVDTQTPTSNNTEKVKRFRELIHLSSSGTSMITTTNKAFRGRGMDHHCKSSLFRDITQWMAMNYNIIEMKNSTGNNVTNILWSTRRPYCCINGRLVGVKRSWREEDKLLHALRDSLGPSFRITSVDFGKISSRKSIEMASKSDIMVGVHGAGLIWSAFMPIHGGLIEIFGGDRTSSNRHYHNVASLADLHYRELSLIGVGDPLCWDQGTVDKLVEMIKSFKPRHEGLEPE